MSTTLLWRDGDLEIDQYTGRSTLLDGADKASQDIGEVLMTPTQQPAFVFPTDIEPTALLAIFVQACNLGRRDYGSELATITSPPMFSQTLTKALVAKKVDEAIQRLKTLQNNDAYITDAEKINQIQKLIVEQLDSASFAFYVQVGMTAKNFNPEKLMIISARQQISDDTLTALRKYQF
jgi:hypothetical protein